MKTELIGRSQNIHRIKELINQVSGTGLNILVYGETGVGKDVVAQILWEQSNRKNKPFVKVNCAALPDTLLESEMFGYERGAYTGAERRKRGKFEQAHGGVLFLDEIGDMSLQLQSKLLHVLQGDDITPLGSERSVKSNTWVIAATNHDLKKDMQNGDFREDLYYRLSTIKIYIEPLRNRPEDIPFLIDHFIKQYSHQFNGKKIVKPSPETIDKLTAYHWHGNVRELQNILKRIIVLGEDKESIDDLLNSKGKREGGGEANATATKPSILNELMGLNDENEFDNSSLSLKIIRKKVLAQAEKEVITYVLEKTGWNRSKATKILDISYKTLLYKIKDLNLIPPSN
jgi:transcriptional regulator with PAS, ATPase and Fis domain